MFAGSDSSDMQNINSNWKLYEKLTSYNTTFKTLLIILTTIKKIIKALVGCLEYYFELKNAIQKLLKAYNLI